MELASLALIALLVTLVIVTYGIVKIRRDKAFRSLFIALGAFLFVMSVLGAIRLL